MPEYEEGEILLLHRLASPYDKGISVVLLASIQRMVFVYSTAVVDDVTVLCTRGPVDGATDCSDVELLGARCLRGSTGTK